MLEQTLQQNPTDNILREEVKQTHMQITHDNLAIGACDQPSATNACTSRVTDTCEAVIRAYNDAALLQQFQDFRKTHTTPEVLAFCQSVAS